MHSYTKIGLSLIGLGFLMFLLAVDQFASHSQVNPFLSCLGQISFIIWLPTFVIGLFFLFRSKK